MQVKWVEVEEKIMDLRMFAQQQVVIVAFRNGEREKGKSWKEIHSKYLFQPFLHLLKAYLRVRM